MKKVAAVFTAVVLVVSLVSLVFAADAMKGTIKSVDAKAGMIVVTADSGKDETMHVDKTVDLGKVKAGDKVMITAEKGTVMSIKAAKAKASVGC